MKTTSLSPFCQEISLDRELSLSHADNFSMTKDTGGNGTVFVECVSQSGRFNINGTTFAAIKGLHFIGCGGNRVSDVEQFIIEDTIFEGVEGRGTALVLSKVTSASIAQSYFLSNTMPYDSLLMHRNLSNFTSYHNTLRYLDLDGNTFLVDGGALYAAFSNVSIVNSKFTHNSAEFGGALFAHNSSLHIIGSTYSYNKANFGGVIDTSESSVDVVNSTFSENAANISGGVMTTSSDSVNIHGAIFTNNIAGVSGGVIRMKESSFRITHSAFGGNSYSW